MKLPSEKCLRNHAGAGGFTLIELLAVIGIITVLGALVFPVYHLALDRAAMSRDIGAGKTLITAYAAYAADNTGRYLPGYDRTVSSLTLADGTSIGSPPCQRYPFRLAPYFDNRMQGTILVNKNAKQIDVNSSYLVSCFPNFGMNYIFVGGDVAATGALTYSDECVTRQAQASGSILVFATAIGAAQSSNGDADSSGDNINGYCILTPPRLTTPMWNTTAWTKKSAPGDYGNVDARYSGKAVCIFLDGSIRTCSIDELRDMRLWSRNALAQNNPNYNIPQSTPPGGRL